jgi:hypothetical protein
MLDISAVDLDPGMFRLLENRFDRRREIRIRDCADGDAENP